MDKYYGKHIIPDEGHIEEREGEVWLRNIKPEEFSRFRWKTKRLGTNAFDIDGELLRGQRPLFVQRKEIEKEGDFCIATDRELRAAFKKSAPHHSVAILLFQVKH